MGDTVRLLAQRADVRIGKAESHYLSWQASNWCSHDLMAVALRHGIPKDVFEKRHQQQNRICKAMKHVDTVRLLAQRADVRIGKAESLYLSWQASDWCSHDLMAVALRQGISKDVFEKRHQQQNSISKAIKSVDTLRDIARKRSVGLGRAELEHAAMLMGHRKAQKVAAVLSITAEDARLLMVRAYIGD